MKKVAVLVVILGLLMNLYAHKNNQKTYNEAFKPSNSDYTSNDSTFKPHGKPIVQVFGHFNYNATKNSLKKQSFGIGRTHLGYEYQFSKQFMGKVVFESGRPTIVGPILVWDSVGTQMTVYNASKEGAHYTIFLKFAFLEWAPSQKFKIQVGSISQNHFKTQENMWKYRFIAETFQDRYFKTPSGDLGIIAYYKPCDYFGFDLAITNGEGFRSDQDPFGDLKIAAGVDLIINKSFENRLFYDFEKSRRPFQSELQQTISFYSGYKWKDKFRVGVDLNMRLNQRDALKQHLFGYSIFSSYNWNSKWSTFVRFDQVTSNRDQLTSVGWVYHTDGMGFIGGVNFTPVPKVNLALHYQGFKSDSNLEPFQNNLFLSFEFLW